LPECKPCPPGKYESTRGNANCTVCPAGSFCQQSLIGNDAETGDPIYAGATSPTICRPGTIRMTLGAATQDDCEPTFIGMYSSQGLPVDCRLNTYQPALGGENSESCIACQPNSETDQTGSTSVHQCNCLNGFLPLLNDKGTVDCVCPPGEGLETVGGAEACVPCPVGKYKHVRGNFKCFDCDGSQAAATAGWTTLGTGSKHHTDCVCDRGFYFSPIVRAGDCDEAQLAPFAYRSGEKAGFRQDAEDENGEPLKCHSVKNDHPVTVNGRNQKDPRQAWIQDRVDFNNERFTDGSDDFFLGHECYACDLIMEGGIPGNETSGEALPQHNCTYKGVTLETIPVLEGFSRSTNVSHQIRWCETAGACKGGTVTADQCYDSQDNTKGPYCTKCFFNDTVRYRGMPGAACTICAVDSDAVTLTFLAWGLTPLFACCFLGICFSRCQKVQKRLLTDRLPLTCEILAGEDPEDVWAMQLEKSRETLGVDYPKTFGIVNLICSMERPSRRAPRFSSLSSR